MIVPAMDRLQPGQQVMVSIRPERIELGQVEPSQVEPGQVEPGLNKLPGANNWPVRVVDSIYQGDHLRLRLDGCDFGLVARTDRRRGDWPRGAEVIASFAASDCWVIAT
jgi:putative spermidine/putrescine transport system ATP-binding protein